MDAEQIKAMIRRFNDEAWNKGNMAVFDEFIAPNYAGCDDTTGTTIGREELKLGILNARTGMADLHLEVDDIVVEGDRAAYHWTGTGTNQEGKRETIMGFTLYRLADGKVVEDRFIGVPVKAGQTTA